MIRNVLICHCVNVNSIKPPKKFYEAHETLLKNLAEDLLWNQSNPSASLHFIQVAVSFKLDADWVARKKFFDLSLHLLKAIPSRVWTTARVIGGLFRSPKCKQKLEGGSLSIFPFVTLSGFTHWAKGHKKLMFSSICRSFEWDDKSIALRTSIQRVSTSF